MKYHVILFYLLLFAYLSSCSQHSTADKSEIIKVDTVADTKLENTVNIAEKYLLGKIIPEKDTMFVLVPKKYCIYRDEYLLKEVYEAYLKMYDAAKKENISLGIVSAFRSFDTQKWLWEKKLSSTTITENDIKKALQYSSMPGISRHHWGTEIDLCSLNPQWYINNSEGIKTYKWLKEHANEYGFYQAYSANRNDGFYEEKWHWSYKKIAVSYLNEYKKKISTKHISGFKGDSYCASLNVIERYVFSIDSLLIK